MVEVQERVLCLPILDDVACAKLWRSGPVTMMFCFLEYCSRSFTFGSKAHIRSSFSFNAFSSSVMDFSFSYIFYFFG